MITPADSAPTAPGQGPAAPNAGPAPVPSVANATAPYSIQAALPDISANAAPGVEVLAGVTGANHVSEVPLAAPNVNPYEAGSPQSITVGGDADAGGRDDVAGSVAGAVAAAQARFHEHMTDTYGQGSVIGDVYTLPPRTSTGSDGGGFYDPPRDYGA